MKSDVLSRVVPRSCYQCFVHCAQCTVHCDSYHQTKETVRKHNVITHARAYVVGVACSRDRRRRSISRDLYLEVIVSAQQAFHSNFHTIMAVSTCPNLEHMDVRVPYQASPTASAR